MIINSAKNELENEDHIDRHEIMSFKCPICHNKTVYDSERDVYRPYEVDYDDLCICEECGAELRARPQYDGTIKFEVYVEEATDVKAYDDITKTKQFKVVNEIQRKVESKARQVMMSPGFGFPEDEVDDYLFVETDVVGDNLKVEVRCELSFEGMMDMAEQLNPIIERYYKYSYFDMEDAGIMNAFIPISEITSCVKSSKQITSSYDTSRTYWMVKYTDIDKQPHKIMFEFDSSDYDEAEEEMDAVIPEPYVSAKLLGRCNPNLAEKDGFKFIESSVEAASYGGAYDIEDDMFFTKEDIVEFGDEVADYFSGWADEEFELSDVYMKDPVNLHLEITNNDIWLDSDIKIDMRKIRKPSDISKYVDQALSPLKESYLEYHEYDDVESSTNIKGSIPEGVMIDEKSEIEAGWESAYDRWKTTPPDPDEPEEPSDEMINVYLDNLVSLDEKGYYKFEDELDVDDDLCHSMEYPELRLDYPEDVEDHILDMLEEKLSEGPGKYKVTGDAVLMYNVSNIYVDEKYYGNDRDGDPILDQDVYTEDADVKYLYKQSYIDNLKVVEL